MIYSVDSVTCQLLTDKPKTSNQAINNHNNNVRKAPATAPATATEEQSKSKSKSESSSSSSSSSSNQNEFTKIFMGMGLVVGGFFQGVADAMQDGEYLTSPYREVVPFFGSHLQDLILDERRCAHAKIEPRVGAPTQALHLIKTLQQFLDTPGIFRRKITLASMKDLRRSLEAESSVPSGTELHVVAGCFLQWLYELPEPLFGFELFDAFQVLHY